MIKLFIFLALLCSVYSYNNINCLKGPSYWCKNTETAQECGKLVECIISNNLQKPKVSKDTPCETCTKYVSALEKQFLPKITKKNFLNILLKNCDIIGKNHRDVCINVVKELGPKVYDALKQQISPKHLCRVLEFCPGKYVNMIGKLVDEYNLGGSTTCQICKEVFGTLSKLFSEINEATFIQLFKQFICKSVPGPLQRECNELVDDFGDKIYKLIESLLDGDRTCPALHLCSSNVNRKLKGSWQCTTCIDIVTVLKKDLAGVSDGDIETFVKNEVCEQVPSIIRGICNEKVDSVLPQLLKQLRSSATPQQLCAANKLCASQVVGGVECEVCEVFVNKMKTELINKQNMEKLKKFVITDICPKLGQYAQQCQKDAELYMDLVVELAKQYLTPEFVCKSFGLCAKQKLMTMYKLNNQECDLCKFIVNDIKGILSNPNDTKKIEDFIVNDLCKLCPYKDKCQTFIKANFQQIVKEIASYLNPDLVCEALGFCPSSMHINVPKKQVEGIECDACELAVGKIKSALINKENLEKLKNFVKADICPHLGADAKECVEYVDKYMDMVIDTALNLLTPEVICKSMGICGTQNQATKVQGDPCQTCTYVVLVLKQILNDPAKVQQIKAFVINQLCPLCPVKDRCQSFLNANFEKIVALVLPYLNNNALCIDLHICTGNDQKLPAKEVSNTFKCEVCEMIVDDVKKVLLQKQHIDTFMNLVKSDICPMLGKYSPECENYVNVYGLVLIDALKNIITPELVCKHLDVCNAQKFKQILNLQGESCEICKFILNDLKTFVSDPKNQDMIKNLIKTKLCPLCPAKTKCEQFVDESFAVIINTIVAEFNVDKICHFARFCKSQQFMKLIKPKNSETCEVCEVLMDEVITIITKPEMETKLATFLENDVCTHLGFIKTECDEAVKTYLPYLFKIAKMSLNSKLVCNELHLCEVPELHRIYKLMKTKSLVVKDSRECEICKFIIVELRQLLSNADLQMKIKNTIENLVCPHFGKDEAKCKQDIEEYYSFALNTILDLLKPSICSDIKICNSSLTTFNNNKQTMMNVKTKIVTDCDICEKMFYLLKSVTPKDTVTSLLIRITSLCNSYKSAAKERCLNHVKNLHNVVMKPETTKMEFCKQFGSCHKIALKTFGENPCVWGPGYWCASVEAAKKCGPGAVKHCTMMGWYMGSGKN